MSAPLIVIGSGLAGYNLIKEIRKQDDSRQIILITQDDGRQYSKPMLSTGFSKQKDADGLAMADAATMAEQLKLEIRTQQTVTAINPEQKTIALGAETLEYSDLVLAMGASPIQIPIDGFEHALHVNDLQDYDRFYQQVKGKKKVLVMGAGLVGTEYAHDLGSAGFHVDLVAPDAQPLSRLVPEPCGQALIPALETLGVNLHLQQSVVKINAQDQGFMVTLDNGQTLEVDVVLSAVGLKANTDIAQAAGLHVGKAIQVNRLLQTSEPHIYALGDCAEVEGHHLLYVLPLMNSARALAKTLCGDATEVKYPVMPIMVKTPSLPVVTCPPAENVQGSWVFEGQSPNIQALFRDSEENLLGYALTGDCVAEKIKLNKELPALLA
ncbi:FAD-dependent oxidoreductase [Bermanella marisrubri]|uniref:Rubredoxin reductase n=1 Tax=Bermanella marisrubri TaxID=207949 RepID=Q1N3Z9_9GAMM|nr:FAD-dependent oxidoreductase [Bermanella marisrubri]EAT13066.1 rubredoxin reductase [Oceanobacter sp. RED65] [Bermanella marisrubri]QIZ82818.1 FAD-dependent oxidoreductase [Bermanella marisrubri]